jgi:hypothetical protein
MNPPSSILLAPLAAIGWLGLAFLELLVRLALFAKYRSQGTTSVLWGVVFGVTIYVLLWVLSVGQLQSLLFSVITGALIALYVYLRGAALENPPVGQPDLFVDKQLDRFAPR